MMRPIKGTLYAGRFYADETPETTRVWPYSRPIKNSQIEDYFEQQKQADRKFIQNSDRVLRTRPYSCCSGCKDKFQKQTIYNDDLDELYSNEFNCPHCHRILHLCECCRHKPCTCPLCSCKCGQCRHCRKRILKMQRQRTINDDMNEKMQDKFSNAEMKRDFRENLHRLEMEKLKLEQELIECQTFEERGRLKEKLFLNERLIKDCSEMLRSQESCNNNNSSLNSKSKTDNALAVSSGISIDSLEEEFCAPSVKVEKNRERDVSPEEVNTQKFYKEVRSKSNSRVRSDKLDSKKQQRKNEKLLLQRSPSPKILSYSSLNDLSPSSSEELPAPEPIIEISTDEKVLFRILGKNALEYFNEGTDVIKIISPDLLEPTHQFTYKGEIIEPEIVFQQRILKFNEFQSVYQEISKIYKYCNLTEFERNCAYAAIVYLSLTQPKTIFEPADIRIKYVLPFASIHRPAFALLLINDKAAANIGIPYFSNKPLLPKQISVRKIGRFELEVNFDSSSIEKCVSKSIQIVKNVFESMIK